MEFTTTVSSPPLLPLPIDGRHSWCLKTPTLPLLPSLYKIRRALAPPYTSFLLPELPLSFSHFLLAHAVAGVQPRQHKTIAPNKKLAVGEKLLLSAAHRTVRCPLSGAPSRWTHTAGDRWHAGFLHRTLWSSCQIVRWSSLHTATWN
jgi:hypothetical protein